MKERGLPYTIDVEDGDGSFFCSVMCNSLLICRAGENSRCNAMRLASGRTINTLIQFWPLEGQFINNGEEVTTNHKKVTSIDKEEVTPNQQNEEVCNNSKELTSENIPEGTSNEKQKITSDNKQEVTSSKPPEVTEPEATLNNSGSDLPKNDADSIQEETKDNGIELHLGKQQSSLTGKILPKTKLPQRALFPHQRTNPAFTKHLPVEAQSPNNSNAHKVASNRRTSVKKVAPQPVHLTAVPSEAPQIPKESESYSTSNSSPSSNKDYVDQSKFQKKPKQAPVPKGINKQLDILQRLDACMKEHNLEYTFELEKCPDRKFVGVIYCNSELLIHIKGKDKLTTRYLALQQGIAKVRKIYGRSAAKPSDTLDSALQETNNDMDKNSSAQQDTREKVSIVPTQTQDLIIFEDNDMELCDDDDDEHPEPQIELPVTDQYPFLNKNAHYISSNGEYPDAKITQQPTNLTSADDLSEEDSSISKVLWPWEIPQKISSKYKSLSKTSKNEESTPTDEDTDFSWSSFKLDKDITLEQYLDSCMKERGFEYSYSLKQFSDKSYLCSVFCDSSLFHCSRGKDIPEAQTLAFQRAIEKLKKWFKIKKEPCANSNANDLFSLKGPDKANQSTNSNQDNTTKDVATGKKKVISNFLKQVRSDRIVNAYAKKDEKIDSRQEKPPEDISLVKKVDKQDDKTGANGTSHVVSSNGLRQEKSNPNKNSFIKESNKKEDRTSARDSKSLLTSNSPRHDRSNHSVSSDPRRNNKRDSRTIIPASKGAVTPNKSLRQSSKRDDNSVASDLKKLVSSNSLHQKRSDPDENSYSKWFGKKENSGITPPRAKDVGTPNSLRNERSSCNENSISKRNDNKKEKITDTRVKGGLTISDIMKSDKCNSDDNSYTKWFGKKHDGTTSPRKGTVPSNSSKQEISNCNENSFTKSNDKREEKGIAPVIKELVDSFNLRPDKSDPDENFISKCFSRIATALRNSIVIPNTSKVERSNIDKNSTSKTIDSKQGRFNGNDKREENVSVPVTNKQANSHNLKQAQSNPDNPYSKWFVKTPIPFINDTVTSNTPRMEKSNIDKNSFSKTNNPKQEKSYCNDKREENVCIPFITEPANSHNLRQEQCNPDENPFSKWFVKTPTPIRNDTVTPDTPNSYSKLDHKKEERITSPHKKDIATKTTTRIERSDVNENYCSKLGNNGEERTTPLSMKDPVALRCSRFEPSDNYLFRQSIKRERSISPYPTKEIKKAKIENFVLLEDSKFKQNDPYSILRRSAAFNKVFLWPKFHTIVVKENKVIHRCSLMIGDELLTEAEGSTSGEAQFKASVLALTKLKSRRPTIKIFSYDT